MKWEKKGGDKRNSKFLLIVAELELIFAWCCGGNVWEALYGRSQSAWCGAWCAVSGTRVDDR